MNNGARSINSNQQILKVLRPLNRSGSNTTPLLPL
jgi:hypothetical protein